MKPEWRQGAYRADPRVEVTRAIGSLNVGWVGGFYNESLTDDLVDALAMWPASYFGIDVDLHASAIAALDWGLRTNVLTVGTMVGYDDWWAIPAQTCSHPLASGEGKAHADMAARYDVEFLCASGPCRLSREGGGCSRNSGWGPIFVVLSIGKGRGTHGFEMNDTDVAAWLTARRRRRCPSGTSLAGNRSMIY